MKIYSIIVTSCPHTTELSTPTQQLSVSRQLSVSVYTSSCGPMWAQNLARNSEKKSTQTRAPTTLRVLGRQQEDVWKPTLWNMTHVHTLMWTSKRHYTMSAKFNNQFSSLLQSEFFQSVHRPILVYNSFRMLVPKSCPKSSGFSYTKVKHPFQIMSVY